MPALFHAAAVRGPRKKATFGERQTEQATVSFSGYRFAVQLNCGSEKRCKLFRVVIHSISIYNNLRQSTGG
jgi:hypothetical protein